MSPPPPQSPSWGPGAHLTIGDLSRRCGVSASALRFYESKGLLDSQRNASGYRQYPRAAIRRVAFIVFAQRVGLTLDEVRDALNRLPSNRVPTREDWTELSQGWTHRIDERMEELRRLRDGLSECIGCGCLSLDRCRLANPSDSAARFGPGPRYWLGDARA